MSTKNFRVSDGDWICPDKKWVREGSRIEAGLIEGGFLRSIQCFSFLRSLPVPSAGLRRQTAGPRAGRRFPVSPRWGVSGAFVLSMPPEFPRHIYPKHHSSWGARWPAVCPHTRYPPQPGFSDKTISLIKASLVLDLPHVTFSLQNLTLVRSLPSRTQPFASHSYRVFFFCLHFVLIRTFLCICLYCPPNTTTFLGFGNYDLLSLLTFNFLIRTELAFRLVRAKGERPVFLPAQPWRCLQQWSRCFSSCAFWRCWPSVLY